MLIPDMAYKLYAFGSNTHNQLGLPLGTDHTTLQDKIITPTATFHKPRLEALRSIHGGAKHTLLLTMGGMAFGAGNNLDFQLALNETMTKTIQMHSIKRPQAPILGLNSSKIPITMQIWVKDKKIRSTLQNTTVVGRGCL
jgi:alpha-tubulin suppressor-like RCC1 family protein